jgi:hypothetical protein
MNLDLRLWDVDLGRPTSLEEAYEMAERLATQAMPARRALQRLAIALELAPVELDRAWRDALMADAARPGPAGYEMRLCTVAPGAAMPTLRAVVERAVRVGLVALSQPLELCFLPDGEVLPWKGSWAAMASRHDACFSSSDSDARGDMAARLQAVLAPHGFVSIHPDTSWDTVFERTHAGGCQRVTMSVSTRWDRPQCAIQALHRDDALEAVFAAVFGDDPLRHWSLEFAPATFLEDRAIGLVIETAAERERLLAAVERHGLAVLDLVRQADGLDAAWNDPSRLRFEIPELPPRAPQRLSEVWRLVGRTQCLKPLIAAWQAGSPQFDELVLQARSFVRGRVDVGEAEVDRLVGHLRMMPARGG